MSATQTNNKFDYPKENPQNISEYISKKITEYGYKNYLIFLTSQRPMDLLQ
jgi:hypothetical protein